MIDISFCPLQCLSSNSDIRGRIKYDLHVLAKSESRFRIAERGNQRTIILFKKKERSMLLVRLKTHIFLIKQMCIFVMFMHIGIFALCFCTLHAHSLHSK